MESPARSTGKDKAAAWKANKEKIGRLIATGLEVNQIEEELQKSGCRITSQLREWIIWEKRVPEVRDLLAQGLDVENIAERMRLNGWIWSDNLKKKALWEFHREEIIGHYKGLRSVESVREIMVKKGFTPQTRIYYEWLRNWGISTSINRTSLSERDALSHPSPFDSNYSTTPGSSNAPFAKLHDLYEISLPEPSQSPLVRMATNSNTELITKGSLDPLASTSGTATDFSNIYHADPGRMEVDKDDKLDTLRENLISHTRNSSSVASSVYQQRVLAGGHFGQQNDYNSHPISTQDGFYWDESDRSDKGEDADDSNFISTVKPTSHSLSAPEIGSASSKHRYGGGPPVMLSGRSDNWMSEKLVLVPGAHRTSSDSGYGSKTSSMQPIGFEYSSPLRNSTSLRSNVNLESNSRQWAFQRFQLHAISCPESHQNIELNCCNYCSYCGTSCLQELALSVFEMTHLQVYDYLSTYMVWQGVRHYDFAGNTFLHKLAAVGAPWEYIEAGLKANIDPCHRNAYGQTFVHVLNISNFQNNLIQCLASLRGRGVDFSLRDASGRTILHCLYGQPMSPHTARQILNLIDESGRQLSLRDVTGRTPWEVLQNTCHQQASVNPRWSIAELQLQMLGIFEDIANSGVLRLESELAGWPKVVDDQKDLQTILQNQYEEVIKNAKNGIVVEAFDGSNAFHAEASPMIIHETMEDLSNLKKFIEVGIDVNQYDSEGRTPLEAIITQPRECETELTKSEKVSLLIDKGGAKVYFRNRLGHTPLYSAAIRGLDRTVESLLLRGSHPNIIANDGQSLLRAVDDAEQEAFMEYLESGRCQYHEAQCSRIEECKMLLKRYGAVLDPSPAQAMGYPPGSP